MAMEVENEEEGTGNGDLGGSVCVQHMIKLSGFRVELLGIRVYIFCRNGLN
mgnify:CR=1 FL=1